jgi:hypothetical protein
MFVKSRFTGEKKYLANMSAEERSLWGYRMRIKELDYVKASEKMYLTFLTITQSDKTIGDGSRWITDLMKALVMAVKRADEKIYYVAVLEIQPKRYKKYGVAAAHWHIAIICSREFAFPHARRDKETGRIQKIRDGKIITWDWLYQNAMQKFGLYFCCDGWGRSVYDYLGKYLAKGDDLVDFKKIMLQHGKKKVRIFSSSRFPIQYQGKWYQQDERKKMIEKYPDIEYLYWRRVGSKLVALAKRVVPGQVWRNGYQMRSRIFYDRVSSISGEWVLDEISPVKMVKNEPLPGGGEVVANSCGGVEQNFFECSMCKLSSGECQQLRAHLFNELVSDTVEFSD